MWRLWLNDDGSYLQLAPAWPGWSRTGQTCALACSLVAVAFVLVRLARWDRELTTAVRARGLLVLRLLVASIAWGLAALQPTFVAERETENPRRVLIAFDRSASMEFADPQRDLAEKLRLGQALRLAQDLPAGLLDRWLAASEKDVPLEMPEAFATWARRVDALSRKEIVRRLLSEEGLALASRLSASHELLLLGFRAKTETLPIPLDDALFREAPKGEAGTDLASPLEESLRRSDSAGGALLGIVLLTDGQHNRGADPVAKATELGRRRIPIYAVPIGSKKPPADLAVVDLKAPSHVAKDAETLVEAKLRVRGIPAGKVRLRLNAPGVAKEAKLEKTIDHDGRDGSIDVSFPIKFEDYGLFRVELQAESADPGKEATLDNNRLAAMIRVASDKTRVLLIDADARWDHHYLAGALQRDPDVAADRILFHQPRLGTAAEAKLEALGHAKKSIPPVEPNRDDPLWGYDAIVLGDVAPEDVTVAERRRLEAYVGERGGTLILHAGKRWQPSAFLAIPDDPLAKLVPIENPVEWKPKTGYRIRPTDAGNGMPFFKLDDDEAENRKIWSELPKHYWGLVGKPKPGATALALGEDAEGKANDPPASIVQQTYGFGKVIYLGLDTTWRWRFRVGDRHHHRFWGQLVRWAGADPWTPGANRFVRLGMTAPTYRADQEPEAAVRLAESQPIPKAPMRVKALRRLEGDREEPAGSFELAADGKRSRHWQGPLKGLPPGSYRLELEMPELQDKSPKEEGPGRRDLFTVLPTEDRETTDLATRFDLLAALAEASGGRVVLPEEVDRLPSLLQQAAPKTRERREERPWQDAPWTWRILALMLGLLTLEWAGRKIAGLP